MFLKVLYATAAVFTILAGVCACLTLYLSFGPRLLWP